MRRLALFFLSAALWADKPGTIVLEDWATIRVNTANSNTDLFYLWSGEDPGQSGGINTTDRVMRVTSDPYDGDCYEGCGQYWDFIPWPYNRGALGRPEGWIKSGTWSTQVNRWYIRGKCDGNSTGGVQVGTYVKVHTDTEASEKGNHYYHEIGTEVFANRWFYVVLNGTPSAMQGVTAPITGWVEPAWKGGPATGRYWDGMTVFYWDTQGNWGGLTCDYDAITMGITEGEPDAYVSSISATYDGTRYRTAWNSFKDNGRSYTYEVRYSTSDIKSIGWSNATDGGTVDSPDDGYPWTYWQSAPVAESSLMYVGIRPRMRVASATCGSPVTINTHSWHYLQTGDQVNVSGVCTSGANGTRTVTVVDTDTITLDGTTGSGSYSSGTGTVTATSETSRFSQVLVGEASGASAPTVTTVSINSVTPTTASSGGNVSSDGGASVTWRGVCYSTTSPPTIADTCTTDGTGTGTYTSSLGPLSPATLYYYVAGATNSAGTSYGTVLSFTTSAMSRTSLTGSSIFTGSRNQ
jgi:hypothetical protein